MRVLQLALAVIGLISLSGCNLQNGGASSESAEQEQAREAEKEKLELDNLVTVTSVEIAQAYDQNTIAADQRYKGKRFKVTGIITDINTDMMGNGYITMPGTNEFLEPQFSFGDEAMNQLAALRKGERITLVCTGQGDIAKTPMSDACEIIPEKIEAQIQSPTTSDSTQNAEVPSTEPEVSQSDTLTESERNAAAVDEAATDASAAVEAAGNTGRAAAYEKYKVEVYRGPIKMPYFTGDQAKFSDYRTKIREAAASGVNFAGKYAVAEIGCGSGCRFAYLINLETGKIIDFPLGGEENYRLQMRYYPDSSMLFAIWDSGDFETCLGELFVLQGDALTSLVKKSDKITCEI